MSHSLVNKKVLKKAKQGVPFCGNEDENNLDQLMKLKLILELQTGFKKMQQVFT